MALALLAGAPPGAPMGDANRWAGLAPGAAASVRAPPQGGGRGFTHGRGRGMMPGRGMASLVPPGGLPRSTPAGSGYNPEHDDIFDR